MTPRQRELARHALGLTDGRKKSYRNRYMVALHSLHEMIWDDLVHAGMAERGRDGVSSVGFYLTEVGARAALDPGEMLDPEDFPISLVTPAERGTP
jgi:hypothetical protein